MFIKDKKLYYVYNFLSITEQKLVSGIIKPGKHTIGMEFIREKAGEYHESIGQARLFIDEKMVSESPWKTQPGKFTLSGDGLCVGFDSGDAVSSEYKTPGTFKGGEIQFVGVTVEKAAYADLEQEAKRALMKN